MIENLERKIKKIKDPKLLTEVKTKTLQSLFYGMSSLFGWGILIGYQLANLKEDSFIEPSSAPYIGAGVVAGGIGASIYFAIKAYNLLPKD